MVMTREPEEILDEPHEQIVERVCVLSVAHPADVVVTENADGSRGFGRHGDADRREVTPVEADL